MKVFRDEFDKFPLGELPFDYTATGEYHCLDFEPLPAGWVEPTNSTGWGSLGNWQIIDDNGRRVMQQAQLRGDNGMPMLAAGDFRWRHLALEAEVRLLTRHTEAGILLRSANNRTHYSLRISGAGRVRLMRRAHEDKEVLAQADWAADCERYHTLRLEAAGETLRAWLDGKALFEVEDAALAEGRIGLLATGPARFAGVEAEMQDDEVARLESQARAESEELAELRARYPQPRLWRQIETPDFGAGRHIRFGDLNGDGRLEILLAQNIKLLDGGNYPLISCLTAIDLDGKVLWQWGEPHREHGMITADLPFQIHDIDGDGAEEVVCCRNFEVCVLEGSTGKLKYSAPTPEPGPMATWLREDDLFRLPVDSICFADLRGAGVRREILLKDRYSNLYAYTDRLEPLWKVHCNTGHYPAVADLDGDGREEIMVGYTLVDDDGSVLWQIDVRDHQDAIAIVECDPDAGEPRIALACGEGGTVVCSPRGEILWRDMTGHVQRLTAARVREDVPGMQIVTKTFWGNPDIICLYDAKGNRLESIELTGSGAVLSPVNWCGEGPELLLFSGSRRLGGLWDGHLRPVVSFPDDGHPTLCAEALDLTGDPRDEIVLWDLDRIWIYTQEGAPPAGPVYRPRRQPHYNMSDYRAEISVPAWE